MYKKSGLQASLNRRNYGISPLKNIFAESGVAKSEPAAILHRLFTGRKIARKESVHA
jgi:hypothetical protein